MLENPDSVTIIREQALGRSTRGNVKTALALI